MGNLGLGKEYYEGGDKVYVGSSYSIMCMIVEMLDDDREIEVVRRWEDANRSEYYYAMSFPEELENIRYVEYNDVPTDDLDSRGVPSGGYRVTEIYYKDVLVFEKLMYDGMDGFGIEKKNAPIDAHTTLKSEFFELLGTYLTKWEEEIRIEEKEDLEDTEEDW